MGLISVNGFVEKLDLKGMKISDLMYSFPALVISRFAMGLMSINDFVKILNLKDMKNNIIRWIGVVAGMLKKS